MDKITTPEILEQLPKNTKVFMTDEGGAWVKDKNEEYQKIGQLNKKGIKTFEKWKEKNL